MFRVGSGHESDALIRLRSTCSGLKPWYLYIVIHGDMQYNCYGVISLSGYSFMLLSPVFESVYVPIVMIHDKDTNMTAPR